MHADSTISRPRGDLVESAGHDSTAETAGGQHKAEIDVETMVVMVTSGHQNDLTLLDGPRLLAKFLQHRERR